MQVPESLQPLLDSWDDSFVAFADVLGFAELMLALPRFVESKGMKHPLGPGAAVTIHQQMLNTFSTFHAAIRNACNRADAAETTALVFSDSVFFKSNDLSTLSEICVQMIRECLRSYVPIRIGVGSGLFLAHHFSLDASARRTVHSSQFMGAAVVNAYRAEKGLKGIRIIGGPTIERGLSEPRLKRSWMPLSASDERVAYELNYLHTPDEAAKTESDQPRLNNELWRRVHEVGASAPGSEQYHYQETKKALQRMNDSLGLPPLAFYPSA